MSSESSGFMPGLGGRPSYRLSLRDRLRRFEEDSINAMRRWWDHRMSEPARRRKTLRATIAGGVVAMVLLGGAGWWIWGPRLQPDYETAGMDEVFDYTLLSDEFNALPLEERLALLGQLVKRMKGMSADDSVLLASFAAGIGGAARKQLEENASRLVIDLWDKHAKEYDSVPPEEREQFLESAYVDFMKTAEALSGQVSDKSDGERINEARRQAQRDTEWAKKNPDKMPDGEAMGTIMTVMTNNVGGHASPTQKGRGQQMMRDMMRHFRGQDISTGLPQNGGG